MVHLFCFKMENFHVAARVITERETGRSKGFGFVNYSSCDDAKEAMSGMDGKVSETYTSCSLPCRGIRVNLCYACFPRSFDLPNCALF